MHERSIAAKRGCYCSRFDCSDAGWASGIDPAAAGLGVCIGLALEVEGKGEIAGGIKPQLSGDETRQTVEEHGEDRLIGGARRQVDLDLGFQFDDAGGEFDQALSQGVELHDAPDRAFGHDTARRPQEPIGAGMQEQAKLGPLARQNLSRLRRLRCQITLPADRIGGRGQPLPHRGLLPVPAPGSRPPRHGSRGKNRQAC
jgi:hypothetical protein